jgi:hypothetical protein
VYRRKSPKKLCFHQLNENPNTWIDHSNFRIRLAGWRLALRFAGDFKGLAQNKLMDLSHSLLPKAYKLHHNCTPHW